MITLIVGSTGAGKTTYSLQLAKNISAKIYSIDNWMKALYGDDMPQEPTSDWFYENHKWYTDRIARCEKFIQTHTLLGAKNGCRSILDLGFTTKDHRLSFIQFYKAHQIPVEIHFLNVPVAVRKQRVHQRNQEKGETYVMHVDDSMFDYMEQIFQPPSSDEGAVLKIVSN